ncbi:hypothetical protein BO70DRAFT_65089 [Aspergillus heteromorphus CBS 117.55]|uniref:Uncharacterized protein n=1 Tax=Aspergillus heteromorphus CBS 117.55 TaxID=1448321 RepID=A0A317VVM0_9EURO|nr:uncharacterized protein BO70DRAFT_65089 [Aspergillus heteromorphus CBS 117.55]PWY77401.1 hypothetical protein BO70DRAFT_65089 [Aspergillus heteromorphus CBS 117.55]
MAVSMNLLIISIYSTSCFIVAYHGLMTKAVALSTHRSTKSMESCLEKRSWVVPEYESNHVQPGQFTKPR